MEYKRMEEEPDVQATTVAPTPPASASNGVSNNGANSTPGSTAAMVSNVRTSKQHIEDVEQPKRESLKVAANGGGASTLAGDVENVDTEDRYVDPSSTIEKIKQTLSKVIDHFLFRLFTIVVILTDLTIVIVAVTYSEADHLFINDGTTSDCQEIRDAYALKPEPLPDLCLLRRLDYVALAFSIVFVIESSIRIFVQTPKVFFRQPLEIVDLVVIWVTLIIVLVNIGMDSNLSYAFIARGFRLVRLIRFVMLIRVTITQRQHLSRTSRLMVSENKRRFQKDGYDLDLCFITDRMIAMSFPSQGVMSIYRNPIEEVSRFFNTKYNSAYRIYNCCSERGYNAHKYFNDSVYRVMIDDHNVPTLENMVAFTKDVKQFMEANRNNVIAIHCKGGKGRTGTMVCTWLLHSKAFNTADEALEYFAMRRTDLSVGKAFQGVQTPSQSRYVHYFEVMRDKFNGEVPPSRKLKPTTVSVSGLKGIGSGNGKDLSIQLISDREVVFEAKFGTDTNCTTMFETDSATISASLVNAPILLGDIKVRFETTSRNVPIAYDRCPWFFWFNTSFIENNEISLGREALDNPHNEKLWKTYKQDFCVTMKFEDISDL